MHYSSESLHAVLRGFSTHIGTTQKSTCCPINNNAEDAIAASNTCDDQDEEISMSSSLSTDSVIHPSSKRRQMVHFASDNNVIHSSSSFVSYVLDDSILAGGWYNRQDLSTMKRTARHVCRSFLNNNIHSSEPLLQQLEEAVHRNDTTKRTSSGHCMNYNNSCLFVLQDETVRGLESLVCSERQRRQYLTRQYVLTDANKLQLRHPHHVKKLAWGTLRVTHYATQIALLEAKHDYYSIYRVAPTNVQQIQLSFFSRSSNMINKTKTCP
jgi:hypothetical protein